MAHQGILLNFRTVPKTQKAQDPQDKPDPGAKSSLVSSAATLPRQPKSVLSILEHDQAHIRKTLYLRTCSSQELQSVAFAFFVTFAVYRIEIPSSVPAWLKVCSLLVDMDKPPDKVQSFGSHLHTFACLIHLGSKRGVTSQLGIDRRGVFRTFYGSNLQDCPFVSNSVPIMRPCRRETACQKVQEGA